MAHNVIVVPGITEIAHDALRLFVSAAQRAINARGRFTVALAGGNTPKTFYELIATGVPWEPKQWPFDWAEVQFFFSDERCVSPDHAQSNFRMANEAMLSKLPLPPGNVHRMAGEMLPEVAAAEYDELLRSEFGEGGLDMVFLGLGDDGHVASLFPFTRALAETRHRSLANYVDKLSAWRLTLTAPFINLAREVVFMVSGQDKAKRVAEVLEGQRDPQRLPAQMIEPQGKSIWILDEPAGAALKGKTQSGVAGSLQ